MKSFVALFRGINVGGNNILPMQKLRELLADLGCEDIATYIQSGNAVFRHGDVDVNLAVSIADAIEAGCRFRPMVLVRGREAFDAIIAENPFVTDDIDPKTLHVWTLESPAKEPDIDRIDERAAENERFALTNRAFYLHAPSGIGRSKLVSEVEKNLRVSATSRNWRTMLKIADMLEH